jgi:arylsulfatase A-like enzyme
VIVLTSDHGEELGDSYQYGKRLFDHGDSLTNAVLNVPLLIKLPRSRRTGSIDEVARSIDLMPTLLSLADPAGTYEGRDLLALEPTALNRQPTLAELVTDEYGPYKMYSVQDSEYRLVETHVLENRRFNTPRLSFYDLGSSDLVQDRINPPKDVRAALERALAEYRRELQPIPTETAKRQPPEVRRLLEQLRGLGYVE